MQDYNCIGVDISKDKFDAAVCVNNAYQEKCFDNNKSGFDQFLKWINKNTSCPRVGMEATGYYSEPLANFLHERSILISVINPLQIKHFAKAKLSRGKTDRQDAKVISQFVELINPREYQPQKASRKELREILQFIDTLKKQGTQLKNQLPSIQSDLVKQEIKASIANLKKNIKNLEKTASEKVAADTELYKQVKLVTSIKGVGDHTAYRFLTYLPDISLFDNAKQLAAFIGVCPRQRESGKFKGKTKMSKLGSAKIRNVCYMPALVMKRYRGDFDKFISNLEKKGLKPKAIIGALMRKLVHIIFGVLKNKKPFDPSLCSK